jgi:3-hydroxybutyryl-CoA dehydrogenase
MIQRVGVVGAGTMGSGIAQLCAQAGFSVLVHDSVPAALQSLPSRLRASFDTAVLKGKLTTQQADRAYHSVSVAADVCSLAGADLVIEAASEESALKRRLFERLDEVCPDAILASNTSSLRIIDLASATKTPHRVVGMHFFNPPVAMKLIELVRTDKTAPEVFQAAWDFAVTGLRKTPVDVKDTPGFIVNRVMRPYYLEGQRLALRGASISAVDAACRERGLVPMGPFELMDLIGLDVNLAITKSIYTALGSPERFKPQPAQERLVAAGALGRKAGRGWHLYEGGKKAGENPEAAALFPKDGALPADELWDEMRSRLIEEAERLVAEGAAGKNDVDTAIKLAMNFPKGPFEWQKESARR